MTTTHTPGPWYIRPGSQSIHIWQTASPTDIKTSHHICGINTGSHRSQSESEANARLIAAAPDLLDALTESLAAMIRMDALLLKITGSPSDCEKGEITRVRAAIDSAKGE